MNRHRERERDIELPQIVHGGIRERFFNLTPPLRMKPPSVNLPFSKFFCIDFLFVSIGY